MEDPTRPIRSVALFPFALSGAGPLDAREADLCRGFACFLERHLSRLSGLEVTLQSLFVAPESAPERRGWLMTNSMWTVEQINALPFAGGLELTHVIQGQVRWRREELVLTLELIDMVAGCVAMRESAGGVAGEALRRFFEIVGAMTGELMDSRSAGRVAGRMPTVSVEAFHSYLLGLAAQQAFMQEMVECEAAFEWLVKAVKADPNFTMACESMESLAEVCFEKNLRSMQHALVALGRVVDAGVGYPRFHALLGMKLLERGEDVERARLLLKDYVDAEPQGALASRALTSLARIHRGRREVGVARSLLRAAIRASGENAGAWEDLGDHYRECGEVAQAEECWRRALQEDPDRGHALANLGEALVQRGDGAGGRVLLERAISLPRPDRRAFMLLTEELLRDGDVRRADEVATEWVEQDEKCLGGWLKLAEARRRLGDVAAARHCVKRGRSLARDGGDREAVALEAFALDHPSDWREYGELMVEVEGGVGGADVGARLLALAVRHGGVPTLMRRHVEWCRRMGFLRDAVSSQERVLEFDPSSVKELCVLADLLRGAGRPVDALGVVERAMALDSESLSLREMKGDLLAELGRLEEAGYVYTNILLVTADPVPIRRKLDRLSRVVKVVEPVAAVPARKGFLERLLGFLRRG